MFDFAKKFTPYGDLGLHGVRLPRFQIDKKYYERLNIPETADNATFLKELCNKAFTEKGINKYANRKEYIERGKMELAVFNELGFVDYVLLIWDIINFCHENKIPVGPGRGSAAGSLVLFFIGITNIDPIKNGLYFERFVSKSRAKKTVVDGITYLDGSLLPDVDSDICYYKRHLVLEYIQKKFPSRTCKILTVNTLSGKLVLKETMKTVLEYSEDEVKVLAGYIDKVYGAVEKLSKAADKNPDLKRWLDSPKPPHAFMSNREAYAIAMKLENLPKNFGMHPSAVAVSYDELEKLCPVQITKIKKEEGEDATYELISGYDMNWVAEFSVKVDVLGLRSVSVVDDVCKRVGLDINTVDLNDAEIYHPLQDLRTPHGIFQIEANTQYKACRDVKPASLLEVSDLMALARPGAMAYIKDYVEYKNGKQAEAIHPELDAILATTKNQAIYQEQMMQIGNRVFKFTLDEAEVLRRIVGKKKTELMPEWKEKVYTKARENGLSTTLGDKYWKILDDSKDYSFNKSHSVSYATLATWTLYLKFKYPLQFFIALLNMAQHEPKPHAEVSKIAKELHYFNIKLLPPDLMISDMDFKAEGQDIRYGLALVKGVSAKTMEGLLAFRDREKTNKFQLFQAAKQSKVGIGILSSLIQAGALASLSKDRCKNVFEAQVFNQLSDKEKPYVLALGAEFGYNLFDLLKTIVKEERKQENGKTPIIKATRWETIKKKCDKYLKIYQMNARNVRLANWFFEYKLLGYVYSSTLFEIMEKDIFGLSPLDDFDKFEPNDKIVTSALVVEVKNTKSKNGKSMLRMTVEDGNKQITVMLYDKSFEKWKEYNKDSAGKLILPKVADLVVLVGKKGDDIIFLDKLTILEEKIYIKLSELKDKEETTDEQPAATDQPAAASTT